MPSQSWSRPSQSSVVGPCPPSHGPQNSPLQACLPWVQVPRLGPQLLIPPRSEQVGSSGPPSSVTMPPSKGVPPSAPPPSTSWLPPSSPEPPSSPPPPSTRGPL